ncbi:MAG TPA: 8-amino-7-oxononanoate synthase [Nitrospiraceae bacterium]|nr:8-amino-7-oxononanoate synthase [Nitrospiraceae bacterium]
MFDEELRKLKGKGLLRELKWLESSQGPRVVINGEEYLNFSSNDYLGLTSHPEIIEAAINALKKYGFGSGASRLLSGSYIPHRELEERIARFKGTEAALIFNTGYSANTGVIPAIVKSGDTVLSDELNHASIIDGARLSKAEIKIYKHRDVNHLEELLKKFAGKKLVITDTVFSMDGDIAPLKDIVSLCKKYDALLIIDDAHATGVLGKTGRGAFEHFGIEASTGSASGIIQMGTLSKAFGCFGAFVAGSKDLIKLLTNKTRSFIYSTALPPALASAAIKAIDIVDSESHGLRDKLWKNRERFYQGLRKIGYNTLDSETPIIPLVTGDIESTMRLSNYLYNNKIFVPAIRPPTVPEGKCRIRFSVTAAHTDGDIDMVLKSLRRFKESR